MPAKLTAAQALIRLRRTRDRQRADGIAAQLLSELRKAPGHRVKVNVGTTLWEVWIRVGRRTYYGAGTDLSDAVRTGLGDYVFAEARGLRQFKSGY